MLGYFHRIAEQKIREAQERGEFDDLPGKGRPIDLEGYCQIPEEMRMAYTVLKNAGCVPPEIALKNEILRIEDLLESMVDEAEKYRQIKKLNYLVTRLNTMRRVPVNFEENQRYYPSLVNRITVAPKPKPEGD